MAQTVSITTMQGSDNVGLSRLTINSNFAALKAAADGVMALLDPIALTLSGIKSLSIDDASASLSSSILNVSKGGTILGNFIVGTTGQSTSVTMNGTGGFYIVQSNLYLGSGSAYLASNSLLQAGNLSVVGEKRAPGFAQSLTGSNYVSLTGPVYSAPVQGVKYLIFTNGVTAGSGLTGLTASLQAGSQGQEVEIFHVRGASGGPVWIDTTNFSNASGIGLTGGIKMTLSGDKIRCVYDGAAWYMFDYTTSVPGGTSIEFNRI